MPGRPLPGLGSPCIIEGLHGSGNHREHGPHGPLPADVKHRTHGSDALDLPELFGKRGQGLECSGSEDVALPGGGPHETLPVARAEDRGHLIHHRKVSTPIAKQGPKVVIDPETCQAHTGGDRADGHRAPAGKPPAWSRASHRVGHESV